MKNSLNYTEEYFFPGKDKTPQQLRKLKEWFFNLLKNQKKTKPELIDMPIDIPIDRREKYGLSRCIQRGPTATDLLAGVAAEITKLMNKLWSVEAARGKITSINTCQHYTEIP